MTVRSEASEAGDRSVPAQDFERRGYAVVDAADPEPLHALRDFIVEGAIEISGTTAGQFGGLDELHRHVEPGAASATFRQRLTEWLTARVPVAQLVFDAFERDLRPLVGLDVLAQRVPNLVVQPPGDPRPTELHRDAPANSPYEVVAWVPLVDCFGTKSMYLLDRQGSADLLAHHQTSPEDSNGLHQLIIGRSDLVEVRYGQALLFWSGLFHGSWVNEETETRLSLNVRYKNLFAPLGMKDPLRYFEVLETTPLTRLGMAFQRNEIVRPRVDDGRSGIEEARDGG